MTGNGQAAAQPASGDVIDQVLARVRQHGGRATAARRLLVRALVTSPGHRTADQLAVDVQASAPEVCLSTIYRNLDELERLNIVDRAHLGHGPATYHLTATAHGHLVCGQCGAMTEVPGQLFSGLAETARATYGFAIEPPRFAVIGRCATCQ